MCSIDKYSGMITFKGENVTKEEHKEILSAEYKIDFYKLGAMPRFDRDIPNIVDYRIDAVTEKKDKLHRGQYKLYLSEVDFLTDYAKYNSLIVYVGAAAGHHINELYDNFKHMNLKYHLYDTNYFDSQLQTKENITLFHEYFTDEHCNNYRDKDVLFISDIRNMEYINNPEKLVSVDMNLQLGWVLNIKPRACMLKFRLPYDSDIPIEYLDGEIRLQAYAPSSTTECRLVAERPYKLKIYIPRDNENRMYYLNRIIRYWYEYDKMLEEYILKKFRKFIDQNS